KDTAAPPPYSPLQNRTFSPSRGQSILDQLTLTRAHHIQSVIDSDIIPLIETQASNGIAQTTIAMIPSDIPLPPVQEKSEFSFDTTSANKPVEVIGFASEEDPRVVRLYGQLNRTEFWRPQVVIDELERVLRESLNASPQLRSPTRVNSRGPSEFEAQQSRRGLLRRIVPAAMKMVGREESQEAEGREIPEEGMVLVRVKLEEVRLRTENEFGLYDTMARQCIIIRVDARC
ncbi:hypothetical protein IQ07DRAFT_481780, partial [Pyrenochaeta sp. DS3sAY3a]